MNKNIIKLLCLTGFIGFIFYLSHDIIGNYLYPNYNFLKQAASDLTATDAESYNVCKILTFLYGIFSITCVITVNRLIKQNNKNKLLNIGINLYMIMNLISMIGYSIFPLSSSGYDGSFRSIMHVYVVTACVVILSIISLILLAIGFMKDHHKCFSSITVLALILMCLGAIGSNIVSKDYFGLVERFSTYSVVIYTSIIGLYGLNLYKKGELK